jgi:hypothetical protein
MGDWLAEHFAFLGVTFQNWMVVAVAIILVSALDARRSARYSQPYMK